MASVIANVNSNYNCADLYLNIFFPKLDCWFLALCQQSCPTDEQTSV